MKKITKNFPITITCSSNNKYCSWDCSYLDYNLEQYIPDVDERYICRRYLKGIATINNEYQRLIDCIIDFTNEETPED